MKLHILLICTLLCLHSHGQYKFKLKKEIVPLSLTFGAGMMDGMRDALLFHYDRVDGKLHLNDKFWNYTVSHTNKYKNNNPNEGEKFLGSKTIFVFTTDGIHLTKFINNLLTSGAIALKITMDKKKWWHYIVDAGLYWLVNRAGFTLIYSQF